MTGCYNTGNVNGGDKSMEIGGVVGDIVAGSTMTACYNTGNVTASNSYAIGGVAGAKFTGTITRLLQYGKCEWKHRFYWRHTRIYYRVSGYDCLFLHHDFINAYRRLSIGHRRSGS
jgi:hypothetical protein